MSNSRPMIADKRKTFRKLHEAGCFVIPNPWNVGSARYLQGLGFKALATTHAGHAHGQGVAGHPAVAADSLTRRIATGVAGLSIEDSPNNSTPPLYDFDLSVARVKAARAAVDRAGGDVGFTARAENFIRGVPDLDDAIRRLKAYAAAGADCLYAPGIKTREEIEAVVKAVAPKPVNFLNSGAFGFTVNDIAAMGVRRISVGGCLARVAMQAFIRTATEIAKDGKFDGFAGLIGNAELNTFFGEDRKKISQ